MKYTVAIFAAIAAVVNGQAECEPAAESIPACALGYIASAASANHGCGLLDFACQCSNSAALVGELAQTLIGACGGDPSPVLSAVSGVCGCVSSNSGAAPLTATPSSCISQAAAIPPCALGYLASAGKAIGQCSIQDFGCQCSNFNAIQGSVAGAVASACSAGGGVQEVIQSANALCSCAGGSGGSGSMGSGSGSGSMASATSAMGSGSGSGSSGSGSAKGSGSMPAATGGSGSSAPKATSSAKAGGAGPSVFTGAAAVPAAVGGGVLAFVGGLVAML